MLKSKLESILFISPKPSSLKKLSGILKVPTREVEEAIKQLQKEYQDQNRGFQILFLENKVEMASSGENSELVSQFVKEEITGELTRPALETLTIIAYRGPISKVELEAIRGVNCSLILRNLSMRGLVSLSESQNGQENGAPYYNVTLDFLKHLGINSVTGLSDYGKLNGELSDMGIGEKEQGTMSKEQG